MSKGQYRVSRTSIQVHEPVMVELKRLKLEHGGATFDDLILHLVLEHDTSQDRREAKGRGDNMAKRLVGPHHGVLNACRGRPKGAKDLNPRKPRRTKLALKE